MMMTMMIPSSAANPVPVASSPSADMRSNSCRYNNGSDNTDIIHHQIHCNNAVNSGNKIHLSHYVHRLQNNGASTNMYCQANYQQHNHEHVGCYRHQERLMKHVSRLEVPCDKINSLSTLTDTSFYVSNNLESQCENKNFVTKVVPPHSASSKPPADPYQHYEEQLITRYNQHQISSPSHPYNSLPTPQVRSNGLPQSSSPFGAKCGGHASSPEPSISPPAGVDRSSSAGSCVSSLSEPVVGVGNSNNRKFTSYHRKKKILDLEDDHVNVGTFSHRYVSYRCCALSHTYRVSQEERTKLREGLPYVKLYRYNPKHLCPKLNGYGDNGQRSLKL